MKKMSKMHTTMKKVLFLVAVATLALLSCQKENVKNDAKKNITLTASIEELSSKADMNASNQLVWAKGDQIGIYIPGWGADINQSFTLEGDGGSTTGSFKRDAASGWFDTDAAQVAFFPWTSANTNAGSDDNNVYYDSGNNTITMYFKLGQDIDGYTSGKMITPLVAPMVWNGTGYDAIVFKHAGAAVKVVVNNFPAGAKTLGMTVDGKDIRGTFSIDPANAGTDAMALVGSEAHGSDVWIHTEPTNAERAFTFIFPVPEVAAGSKYTFDMYDKNNVLVWSRTATNQPAVSRGKVLAMPALTIKPYSKFTSLSTVWTVIGTMNSTNWDTDFPMITDGTFCIAKGLQFAAGGEFKVRAYGDFNQAYPGSNVTVADAGTYDVIIELDGGWPKRAVAVPSGECPYPSTSGIGKGSNLSDPTNLTGDFGTYFN